jgi:hypothetical protein
MEAERCVYNFWASLELNNNVFYITDGARGSVVG